MNRKWRERRLLSLLLALVLLVSMVPVYSQEAESAQEESTASDTTTESTACEICGNAPCICAGESEACPDCGENPCVCTEETVCCETCGQETCICANSLAEAVPDYSSDVGKYAKLNEATETYFVSNGEQLNTDDALWFLYEEFEEDTIFEITDWYWNESSCALWYQVEIYSGGVIEDVAEYWPEDSWILQTYTDDEEYEVSLEFVEVEESEEPENPCGCCDSCTGDETCTCECESCSCVAEEEVENPVEEEPQPSHIVSCDSITVKSEFARFIGLKAISVDAPEAYFINRAVAWDMFLSLEDGYYYTGHATVTIPIPEDWDSSLVFGFVVEPDGSVAAIPGTVTKYGTFTFTVPHFSEVGLLEATAVGDVSEQIVVGQISDEITVSADTQVGTAGRYVTDDGAVDYLIQHYTVDGTTQTTITFKGLDVTSGTQIILGNTSYVVVVTATSATVEKLLAGGEAASTTLDPLYDLGISGDYEVSFEEISDESDLLTLDKTTGEITNSGTGTGTAVVTATATHSESKNVVGVVTYNVTLTDVSVSDVKHLYVPVGETVEVAGGFGEISDKVALNTGIATAEIENGTLSVSGVAEGKTAVVVDEVLFVVYVEPENEKNDYSRSIYFKITTVSENSTVYYAINGGDLHKVEGTGVLIGLSETQAETYPDGFNIMIFSAPDEGYATTTCEVLNGTDVISEDFYSLVDGVRYNGTDSSAWPFTDADATTVPTSGNDSAWKVIGTTRHGFRWCLMQGNMTIDEMSDLFTRAIALGCDSVFTFTRNDTGANLNATSCTIDAGALPTFSKTITSVEKADGSVITYTEENPYDGELLEIGDTITYTFTINVTSSGITYSNILIVDDQIGKTVVLTSLGTGSNTATMTYQLKEDDLAKYANGEFWNSASLSYSYASASTKGSNATETKASVKCNISSIVTWTDKFGNIWKVATKTLNDTISAGDMPAASLVGYTLNGWYGQGVDDTGAALILNWAYADGGYSGTDYTVNTTDGISIMADWEPTSYKINYDLGDGTSTELPYTIEDTVTLPTPTREGYTFKEWKVTKIEGEGNWTEDAALSGGMVLMRKYGNVTLTAQWDVITYTVTFLGWNGTELKEETVAHGSAATAPDAPAREGYTFIGWDKAFDYVTSDLEVTAIYMQDPHVVTFVDWDGTVLKQETVEYGSAATAPSDPVREGYEFVDWDKDFNNVTEDITVTALYKALLTTLTIKVTGSADIDKTQSYIFDVVGEDDSKVTVTVQDNGETVIYGVTIGKTYAVTMQKAWSWRYTPDKYEQSVTIEAGGSEVTFAMSRTNEQWLDGNAFERYWMPEVATTAVYTTADRKEEDDDGTQD